MGEGTGERRGEGYDGDEDKRKKARVPSLPDLTVDDVDLQVALAASLPELAMDDVVV